MKPKGKIAMNRSHSAHALRNCDALRVARCLAVSVGAALWLLGAGAETLADRPAAVDHSTSIHFPPIGDQEIGDCTCWSSAYYYNTYTQAHDEGLDASTGNPDVICSPRFLFGLIAEGGWGAECTEHAMSRLADVGCAPVSQHSMSAWYTDWPTEAAWIAALNNRTAAFHQVRADNTQGLETVKQHIADGGCAVTRALFRENYASYGDTASGSGIHNHVMYMKVGWNHLRHSLCICGYDDNMPYFDTRDGQVHYGAFLIANSEGPDWGWYNSTGTGTKGFLWVAYTMFLEGTFGRYDNDDNPYTDPCYDNPLYPEIYYHDDRPQYRPTLYALAGINHNARNLLTFTGGIGPTASPEFTGPQAIEQTDDGDISIDPRKRVAVDLSDGVDLLLPGVTKNVFVSLTLDASATQPATISSVDFRHDFDGDGTYTTVSATGLPMSISPGHPGYVSASVTRPIPGDFDGDFDVDVTPACNPADLARDGDVDAADFAAFQVLLTGPQP